MQRGDYNPVDEYADKPVPTTFRPVDWSDDSFWNYANHDSDFVLAINIK